MITSLMAAVAAAVIAAAGAGSRCGDVLVVDPDGGEYTLIQDAIDAAEDGDIVSVEPGTYDEDLHFKEKRITVIAAQGPEVTTLEGASAAVTFDMEEGSDSILSGFTITSAHVGVDIDGASPRIESCVFTGHVVQSAVRSLHGSPAFVACTFVDNDGDEGAAMNLKGSGAVRVQDCVFERNYAMQGYGSAIYSEGIALTVEGSTFRDNEGYNGTVAAYNPGTVVLARNVFCGNQATYGGAVHGAAGVEVSLSNNILQGNAALIGGGALSVHAASVEMVNNTLVGNQASADQGGHVLLLPDAAFASTNDIYAFALAGDGIVAAAAEDVQIDHGDFWDNEEDDAGGELEEIPAGNLFLNPDFVEYSVEGSACDDANLRLAAGSYLIDAGDPEILDSDGSVSDLGAYGGPDPLGGSSTPGDDDDSAGDDDDDVGDDDAGAFADDEQLVLCRCSAVVGRGRAWGAAGLLAGILGSAWRRSRR